MPNQSSQRTNAHTRLTILGALLISCTTPTSDSSPPTISLNANTTNFTSAGDLTLTATTGDNIGVVSVEFFKGNTSLTTDTSAPFSASLPISRADNGTISFKATAKDSAGNSGSQDISVQVNIPESIQADTTPPTVQLEANLPSVTSETSLTLTATASDNVGVTSVEFFKNGSSLGTLSQAPYNKQLQISIADNGTVEFTAKASDAVGNTRTSTPVNVSVNIKAVWPKQFGTDQYDLNNVIKIDANNIIVAGTTYGSFNGYPNPDNSDGFSNPNSYDAFVAKYNQRGQQLWIKQFGNRSGNESVRDLEVDTNGNIFMTGITDGSFANFKNAETGSVDGFITRFDSSGNQVWLKQIGTVGSDYLNGITFNAGGIVVAGTVATTLPGTTSLGGTDALLIKYDSNGNQVWTKQFGTSDYEQVDGLSTDSNGNLILTGFTTGAFPGFTHQGSNDGFVGKFDSNGNRLWISQFGNDGSIEPSEILADTNGNLYISGQTSGAFTGYSNNNFYDAFLIKYDPNGNRVWLRQFGSTASEYVGKLAISQTGQIAMIGATEGALPGFTNLGEFGDIFVSTFDLNGQAGWKRQFGTTVTDGALSAAYDNSNNLMIGAHTDGAFPGFSKRGVNFDAVIASFTSDGFQR
jgi:Bacterial Ig domain/Beta-propeller repeat